MPRKQYGFYESVFAPEITTRDGVEMEKVDALLTPEKAERQRRLYEEWQSGAEAVKIPANGLPVPFIENLVFGALLSDKVIDEKFVEDFGDLTGSSGIGSTRNSMVANFFSNTVDKDDRINMQYIRSGIPKARQLVKEMLEKGDVNAMEAALKNAVSAYVPAISAYGGINSLTWNESVYRFDSLVTCLQERGIDLASIGIDQRAMDKLNISRQVSDLWNESKDIESSISKNDVLTGADREKRIRAEAIATLFTKLGVEHHDIADAYGAADQTYGDIAQNLERSEKKALNAPLTKTERTILEKGAEALIAEYTATLTAKYAGKEITASNPVQFGYTTLNEETAPATNTRALWEGMKDYDKMFDSLRGGIPEVDRRMDIVKRLNEKISADPDHVEFRDVWDLRFNVERLHHVGDSYDQLLEGYSPGDENLPPEITFDSKKNAFYNGKDPSKLQGMTGAAFRLDKIDLNELHGAPFLRSYTEFMTELSSLGDTLAADTGMFSKNSGEYNSLCRAMRALKTVKPEKAQNALIDLMHTASDYIEHVGDTPKNARQARRLEISKKIEDICIEMKVTARLDAAKKLDSMTPEQRLNYRRKEVAARADHMIDSLVPFGSTFTITKNGDGFKITQNFRERTGNAPAGKPVSADVLGRYLYLDAVRKNTDKLSPEQLNKALDPKTIRTFEILNAESPFLEDALNMYAGQKHPVSAEKIEDGYVANRIIASNKDTWSKLPDDKLTKLRQDYQKKIAVENPSERDVQVFTKLTEMMADRNMSSSFKPKEKAPEKPAVHLP